MKRLVSLAFILGISAVAQAQEAPPIARYVPPAPDARHVFITDSAHILSPATVAWLQDSAQALQASTGADIAWVTLPTLGGRAIEEASVYLGRTWKIGSLGAPGDPTRNRGLVILYIPDKANTAGSNFRVEVGMGLQGTITDSRSRAISAAMREDLRAKRFDDAYLKGWNAAAKLVREDFANQGSPARTQTTRAVNAQVAQREHAKNVVIVFMFFGVFFGIVTLALLIGRRQRRGLRAALIDKGFIVPDNLRSDSIWSSVDTSSSSDSGSSGGDFGGGGGFDGGGSSDSI